MFTINCISQVAFSLSWSLVNDRWSNDQWSMINDQWSMIIIYKYGSTWLKNNVCVCVNFSSSTWLNDQNDHLIIWSLINDHLIKADQTLIRSNIHLLGCSKNNVSPFFSQNDILYRTFSYNKIIFQRCSGAAATHTHYF